MQATRYRLRPTTGITLGAVTYGAGEYGSQTYGQSATDPVAAQRYWAIPEGGMPTYPGVLHVAGDERPLVVMRIWGDDEQPLNLDPAYVEGGTLILIPLDGSANEIRRLGLVNAAAGTITFNLNLTTAYGDQLYGDLAYGPAAFDPMMVGVFTGVVEVAYKSGRTLGAPFDESMTIVIGAHG